MNTINDWGVGRLGGCEEVRSLGDQLRGFAVGILIGRRNSFTDSKFCFRNVALRDHADSQCCTTDPTLATSPREITLSRRLTKKMTLKSAPLGGVHNSQGTTSWSDKIATITRGLAFNSLNGIQLL